jgi:hypothetical protein
MLFNKTLLNLRYKFGSYPSNQIMYTMKKSPQFFAATLVAIVSFVAIACNKSTSLENGSGVQELNLFLQMDLAITTMYLLILNRCRL